MAQAAYKFGKDSDGFTTLNEEDAKLISNKDYLPVWNPNKKFPPLKFFKHIDRATYADPEYKLLFSGDYKLSNLSPKLGTEIRGIQLSQLDDKGKDELALLAAKRGVLVFRDQDFVSKGPEFVSKYGNYFGPLHVHPIGGSTKAAPDLIVVYRTKTSKQPGYDPTESTSSVAWHNDISFELQPSGLSFLSIIEGPESGGDTVFADSVEAYKRLSPEFQKFISGLQVEHSSVEQANYLTKEGLSAKRAAVKNVHPLVRVHPVTGEKILFTSPAFTRRIVGLKRQESDALLKYLYEHVSTAQDLQIRASWEPNTVVIWDNRVVQHSAISDWHADESTARLLVRVSPQAERPVGDLKDLNKEDVNVVVE